MEGYIIVLFIFAFICFVCEYKDKKNKEYWRTYRNPYMEEIYKKLMKAGAYSNMGYCETETNIDIYRKYIEGK